MNLAILCNSINKYLQGVAKHHCMLEFLYSNHQKKIKKINQSYRIG